ncbi:hypothetical protein BDY21DRAFT_285734 [Lineolata rhizophorae]|uniref:BRCT domain-containing protein n=1 Tax=Lineolata rhizophorae TaxID=578093 RepID=A0A6A6P1J7_9PEZI|nr:hypothetical protein BDY21DRAFT_285734 [Lineolata rhizophorae]
MPPPPTRAPAPTKQPFDPWNACTTGHQRAENRAGKTTSWRDTRSSKLSIQFAGRHGAPSGAPTNAPATRTISEAPGVTDVGQKTIKEAFFPKSNLDPTALETLPAAKCRDSVAVAQSTRKGEVPLEKENSRPQIFRGLCVYINGSTAPLVSDHKLRHLLAEHGATLSIALGRKSVTHVILGSPNRNGRGAGGGLAAGKLQKEITRVGGKGIKFVGVDWVLESVKAGKRLSEGRFSVLKIAPERQRSVLWIYSTTKSVPRTDPKGY